MRHLLKNIFKRIRQNVIQVALKVSIRIVNHKLVRSALMVVLSVIIILRVANVSYLPQSFFKTIRQNVIQVALKVSMKTLILQLYVIPANPIV